ncbi:aflatoxin B1-aldehyde reductase [Amylostereum chailletii]|nr:aflatoxin B1-aldehyde reductase [Amylostereum chailletii]
MATFGAPSGEPGKKSLWDISDVNVAQGFVDALVKHGHNRLDTARRYGNGQSEEIISRLDLKGCIVDTKRVSHHTAAHDRHTDSTSCLHGIFPGAPDAPGNFKRENVLRLADESIKALNGVPIDTFYLHAPDRSTPFEETLGAIDELYKQGVFKHFGPSNFYLWEVAEIVTICRLKDYVQPTVYQGTYNVIDRVAEDELFPCLRRYSIRFAAYSPLAGGLLTGFSLDDPKLSENNFRFNPQSGFLAARYISRYGSSIDLLKRIRALGNEHELTLTEIAVRWLVHHSKLHPDDLGIIYGGRKLERVESVLDNHAKGPLPDVIVQALDDGWKEIKGHVPSYSL